MPNLPISLAPSGAFPGHVIAWDGSNWSPVSPATAMLTAPGDLLTFNSAPARLSAGADGQILTADSTQPTGLKWAPLPPSGVTVGAYGSATQAPVVTIDANGRITTASSVTISGTAPGGSAGGGLAGAYPNPGIANLITAGAIPVVTSSGVVGQSNGFAYATGSQELFIGPGGSESAIRLPSLDISRWSIKGTSSTLNAVRDNLLRIGWNVDQEDATEPQWLLQWETHFRDVPVDSDVSEFHLAYTAANGAGRRPIQINVYRQGALANTAEINFAGGVFIRPSDSGTANFIFQDGGNLIANSATKDIRSVSNNAQWLKQAASDGVTFKSLIFLDGSNQISLAPDGGNTVLGGRLGIGLGGPTTPTSMLDIAGVARPSDANPGSALNIRTQVNPTNSTDAFGIYTNLVFNVPAAAVTNTIQSVRLDFPVINLGAGASLQNAHTVYIQGAPTGALSNYALYVDVGGGGGASYFGGQVTLGTLKPGSVPFVGASGSISDDNSHLFWNSSNQRLGIGTKTPAVALHIKGTGGQQIIAEDPAGPYVSFYSSPSVREGWFGYGGGVPEFSFQNDSTNGFTTFRTAGAERFRIANNGFIGFGASSPSTLVHSKESKTITAALPDGFAAAITLEPRYTAATPQPVTRHNYLALKNVIANGAGPASVADAAVLYFDAAAGTHKALDAGTAKTSPGAVSAWLKLNINGQLFYVPAYASKTA